MCVRWQNEFNAATRWLSGKNQRKNCENTDKHDEYRKQCEGTRLNE